MRSHKSDPRRHHRGGSLNKIAHSSQPDRPDVWGIVALVTQLGGFLLARLLLPPLAEAIEQGSIANSIFLAGLSVSLRLLDAACMAG
jgi:uncharacterized membrane protein YjfL (UPF0719 family)